MSFKLNQPISMYSKQILREDELPFFISDNEQFYFSPLALIGSSLDLLQQSIQDEAFQSAN